MAAVGSVDEYIGQFSGEVRARLDEMRAVIRSTAPDAVESMAYGMPAYKLDGKPLVYFAGYDKHVGFYATPNGHEAFAEDFAPYARARARCSSPTRSPYRSPWSAASSSTARPTSAADPAARCPASRQTPNPPGGPSPGGQPLPDTVAGMGDGEGRMATEYSFRQRFELAPGGRLPFGGLTLAMRESDGVTVELRSIEDKPISDSTMIALWGRGFPTEEQARVAGNHWRGVMQRALAGVDVGANFGLRNPTMGGFTNELLAKVRAETGVTVYRDSWDLLVFPSEPAPRFSSSSAVGYATSPPAVAVASIAASAEIQEPPNEVAFDLYSASMRSGHMADVRLVLLVMAIECLVDRVKRQGAVLAHIEQLVAITFAHESLETEDRESLANALRGLRYGSTRKAVTNLAMTLDPSAHAEDPPSLVREAFDIRNALVHGRTRPDLQRVRYVGANLERMVGDLIAGPAVAAAARAARQAPTRESTAGPDS